ncbi:MAG: alpha/beta hydrolase [Acidimicrobiales bacterium]|nr:alpha/beta hydrolase [Acidimicrobiales bacterium]
MTRKYANTELGQIHYQDLGSGEPIVLLHQTASSSVMYERSFPYLKTNNRIIAIDTPGFGLSDPPLGPDNIIEHYSNAVSMVLDDANIEKAHVVGFHTGATTAIDFSTRFQERIKSLTIFCVLALMPDERDEWLAREDLSERWEPDGEGLFLEKNILDYVAWFATANDGETYLKEIIAKLQAGPNYWWAYEGVIKYDHYDRYKKIECPTLVLNAEDEVLFEYTLRAHELLPDSKYKVIPCPQADTRGWTAVVAEHPKDFSEAIQDFINSIKGDN